MTRTKHLYKRFFSLFIGQAFFIRRGKIAAKVAPFAYREPGKGGPAKIIAPWRKVRTLIPVTTTGRLVENHNVQSANAHRELNKYGPQETTEPTGEPYTPDNPVFCREKPLRDPMVQDHTPDQVPTHERNGPAS